MVQCTVLEVLTSRGHTEKRARDKTVPAKTHLRSPSFLQTDPAPIVHLSYEF